MQATSECTDLDEIVLFLCGTFFGQMVVLLDLGAGDGVDSKKQYFNGKTNDDGSEED